jgi:mRNA interferase MazF
LNRGDVILVVTPRDKPRPAVIVQSDQIAGATVLIAPITSEAKGGAPIRVPLAPGMDNGLHVESEIMVDKLTNIAREKIRGRIGRLSEAERRLLDATVLFVLGFHST